MNSVTSYSPSHLDLGSVHTTGHLNCPACGEIRDKMIAPAELARLQFRDAAQIWLKSREGTIGARTLKEYAYWITYLGKFFDQLKLEDIHPGHVESYQSERGKTVGPVPINHECSVLTQILKRAGLWHRIEPHYKPRSLPRPTAGRAMEPEEEKRLFETASRKPRWKVAYCCMLITTNTTAGPNEIRNLRMRNIALGGDYPHIRISEGTKNDYRIRDLPLNESAMWAVRELHKRAKELGAVEPHHYLLPHRAHAGYLDGKTSDPTRPASSWRTAWENLRAAAGLEKSIRLYDLRHHAITRLLENEDVSERTVIELAGHVSKQMLNRYSHIRMRTKKEAVDALTKKSVQGVGVPHLVLVKK